MPQCHICQKKVSVFNSKGRKLGPDKLYTCETCIPEWHRREKDRAVAALYEGEAPVELFRIPGVKHIDATNPQAPLTLYGTLVFTQKAVLFAASADVQQPDQTVAMQFGLLGALVSHLVHGRKQKRAREAAERRLAEVPGDLAGVLEDATRLIVIPVGSIRQIKHGWASGLKIRTHVRKESKSFVLPEKRQTYEMYREAMSELVQSTGPGEVR